MSETNTPLAVRQSSNNREVAPLSPFESLIAIEALAELATLVERHEARGTLLGIAAIKTILTAELVEHIKGIGKNFAALTEFYVGHPKQQAAQGSAPTAQATAVGTTQTPAPAAAPGASSGGSSPGATSPGAAAPGGSSPNPGTSPWADVIAGMFKRPADALLDAFGEQKAEIKKANDDIAALQKQQTASATKLDGLEVKSSTHDTQIKQLFDDGAQSTEQLRQQKLAIDGFADRVYAIEMAHRDRLDFLNQRQEDIISRLRVLYASVARLDAELHAWEDLAVATELQVEELARSREPESRLPDEPVAVDQVSPGRRRNPRN